MTVIKCKRKGVWGEERGAWGFNVMCYEGGLRKSQSGAFSAGLLPYIWRVKQGAIVSADWGRPINMDSRLGS